MTYTVLACCAVLIVVALDLWVIRTKLVTRKLFWVAYVIVLGFQLVTNAVLTGLRVVSYSGSAIVGSSTPADHAPAFIGDGRLVYAPIEDLLFGFSLVLLTLALWVMWGRSGVQRKPFAGPPREFRQVQNDE